MKRFLVITAFFDSPSPLFNCRRRNLVASVKRTMEIFDDADVVIVEQDNGTHGEWVDSQELGCMHMVVEPENENRTLFHKTLLLNRAVRDNPGYEGYVMVDADVYLVPEVVSCIRNNIGEHAMVYPFGDTMYLDELDTRHLIAGEPLGPWEKDHGITIRRQTGLCFAFRQEVFDALAGFDIDFIGWGAEDDAFMFKCRRLFGDIYRTPSKEALVYHMFHPKANNADYMSSNLYRMNRIRCACIRRMDDADFADYLAGKATLHDLIEKYTALGRLEVELYWKCSTKAFLNMNTTIYDIDRSTPMTMTKVLDAIEVEDGPQGILEFIEHVLNKVPGLPEEMLNEVEERRKKAAAICSL